MIEGLKLPNMSDWTDDQAEEWYNSGQTASFSTRNSYEAIEAFDDLLAPFGLQVGLYSGDSDFRVSILPLEGGPSGDPALEAMNRQLADAMKNVETANKERSEAIRKIDNSSKHLTDLLKKTPADDAMSRALIMAQLDFATRLNKDIRGY